MLEVRGLSVKYGSAYALETIDLTIREGEFVTLLGSNGAGKTTLFGVLSGLVKPLAGSVVFNGRDISRLSADRIVQHGIAQCPEGRRLFPQLSVEKNLQLGGFVHRRDRKGMHDTFAFVCELFPALRDKLHAPAGALSGGQQQMVAIGRALMARPKLLLLDEPSLGLAPLVVQQTLDAVSAINRTGTMVLLAEQNAYAALAVSHRGYVIQDGRIVLEGLADDLRDDKDVRRAFIGA
ncbi:MAG: ABC transporter ATP-binding protein [Candidatus Eremiobacteraeota bacterium]|nr:ABC transporter ATP-binding protein [Candidatus Eremiobacteraeota bacterium]